jgi:hypothetical protein
MNDRVFRGEHESLNYALARYLCLWLDQRNQLWPFYHQWRDHYATDPHGDKAFAAVVGKTPDETTKAWQLWLRRL